MTQKNPLEDIKEIRKMMETSSKFLSLSGLSGISAGLIALAGTYFAWFKITQFEHKFVHDYMTGQIDDSYKLLEFELTFGALIVLILAVGSGFLFTYLSAKKKGHQLFSPVAFKLAWSMGLPLAFGGAFTLILVHHQVWGFIGASTLLFYGLALLNASKYVHVEIKYLAICQMSLGLLSAWFATEPIISLYFWAVGFGVLHIFYGAIMYFKYDRK